MEALVISASGAGPAGTQMPEAIKKPKAIEAIFVIARLLLARLSQPNTIFAGSVATSELFWTTKALSAKVCTGNSMAAVLETEMPISRILGDVERGRLVHVWWTGTIRSHAPSAVMAHAHGLREV